MSKASSSWRKLLGLGDLWLTAGLFGTILLMILPVSPILLDGLLALNIALSLLVMLVILYVKEPTDFNGFPTLLLLITLYRLALNVATTRLILLDGYAGHIVEAFGNFAVGGNYVVGLVIFLILVGINFIVITKGAGRIAEVAARFTLDAMPGKQMSIDAELNAGAINETTARERRRKVEQEADFYGAMDGASKFVRGDAIAAILITLINVFGGFAIGILQKGMSVSEALQRFTLLSIGDGLVSQIPALIVSTAAGVLVTRAASKADLGTELRAHLLFSPRALYILAAMLVVLGIIPGLPFLPFFTIATATFFVARALNKQPVLATGTPGAPGSGATTEAADKDGKPAPGATAEKLESLLALDTLQVELGYGLVSLADKRTGGDLLERVTGVRRTFAREMGMLVPPIRVRDNLQLKGNEYRFLLKGNAIARGELIPGQWLAMNATNSETILKGTPTVEPVFQLPATWISDRERENAAIAGYTIVDAASVLVTHLSECVKRNAHEILTRQDVQNLLDNLKQTHPTIVSELIPGQLSVGQVQRILQNFLAEGVPVRNLAGILEKVSDFAGITKNPDELSEYARRAVSAQITKNYQNEKGAVRAITLDPRLEAQIAEGMRTTTNEISLVMDPKLARHIVDRLSNRIQQLLADGHPPVILCAPQIRLAFRRFFETTFAELAVLSYSEIPARVEIQNAAVIPCLE